MPKFSDRSKRVLLQCHSDIQAVMNTAIKYTDFMVLCGYRGKKAQNEAARKGNSLLVWPNSKHNAMPALAVDIKPYSVAGEVKDLDYVYLAGFIMAVARIMLLEGRVKHVLRWGRDWNMNDLTSDETFIDAGHFEIK